VTGASSVTVTLSAAGAADQTTTTAANGTYSFAGLSNGTYTVTASKASYTMTPRSTVVVVNGADQANVNFTAAASGGSTYAISGTVTKAWGGALSGVTVTLSGSSGTLGTVVTGANGSYSFTGNANGSYTVTASLASWVFTPAGPTVTVNGADSTKDFTADGAYAISGTITTAWATPLQNVSVALSGGGVTKAAVLTDASGAFTISGVPNGSFTITPTLAGYAFTPSAPTVAVSGGNKVQDFSADGAYVLSGTVTTSWGAPLQNVSVALAGGAVTKPNAVTGADGKYSFAVPDGTFTVTPALTSYTFTPATPSVAMGGANKTQDFTANGIYTVSGTVTTAWGTPLQNASVVLGIGGASKPAVLTNASGVYTITGVPNGSVTVTPTLASYVFTPAAPVVAVNGANQNQDFSASGAYSISGTVTGVVTSNVSIALSGGGITKPAFLTGPDGAYSFTGLPNGSYTLTATLGGYTVTPSSPTVLVNGGDANQGFVTSSGPSYSISGQLTGTGGIPLPGMTVRLSGASTAFTYTDASGSYSFGGLASGGSYTVTPATFGYTFSPASRPYTVTGDVTNASFSSTSPGFAPITYGGNVSYAGTKTGPVYVAILGNGTASGTGLAAQAGPWSFRGFSVRNVVAQNVEVVAWMDTLGIGRFDAAADPSVTLYATGTGTAYALGDLQLVDPVGVPSVSPGNGLRIEEIVPFDQGAVVAFSPPYANGHEAADSYRVYWNTSSTVDSTHTLGTLVVRPGQNLAILKGLTNGTAYWFRVEAYAGAAPLGQGQSIATTSSTTVGPPAGSATVTGTVSYPSLPAGSALYVVVGTQNTHYVQRIANPPGSQTGYSLSVPPGTYQLITLVDLDDDGVMEPGEPIAFQSGALMVLAAGANAGPPIAVQAGRSLAAVTTHRWANPGMGPSTSIMFAASSNLSPTGSLPLAASVSGPGIPGRVADLAADVFDSGNGFQVVNLLPTDPIDPVVGDGYAFQVGYTVGSPDTFSATVTGLFGGAPTLFDPTNGATDVSTTPTFQWSAPASPPTPYTYELQVGPQNGGTTAWRALLPSVATQANYNADGTAVAAQLGALSGQQWQLRAVDANGNDATGNANFTTGTTQLVSYDPLTASTLDGQRWQTPQFTRQVLGGQALLKVQADDMQGRLVQGYTYSNQINVSAGAGNRVTTLQSDVTVPAASASHGGSATAYISAAVRINYQPGADRIPAFPGSNSNFTTVGLELYDGAAGPKIRARAFHCDDPSCTTFSDTGITPSAPPAGFTQSGVNQVAAAAYDQTYTFTVSMNESTGVFTWTVAGGTFGAGVTGSADLGAWVTASGMQLDTANNGYHSAQLMARAWDESLTGGGSGEITPEFDNVYVGTNGAAATFYDDFATMGSNAANGFSAAKWGAVNGSVLESGGSLHVTSKFTAPGTTGGGESTSLNVLYPATFNAWQADLAVVADSPAALGTDQVQMGGAFFYDGTPGGGPNNPLGGVYANVILRESSASYWVARCTSVANGGCSFAPPALQQGALTTGSKPLVLGSVHTLFEQWDPISGTFTFRLDDGTPVHYTPPVANAGPPWVPNRYIQTSVTIPTGAAVGTSASIDATVNNVMIAP
jgi:hypothetical protein